MSDRNVYLNQSSHGSPLIVPERFMDDVASLMREAAARIVLPIFRKLPEGGIKQKADRTLVTTADINAERFLSRCLPRIMTNSVVVGEEAYSQDTSILSRINGDSFCWIIDPVDGTKEFAAGSNQFRMMVALTYKGEPLASWMLAPNVDDMCASAQSVICAAKGEGTWLNGFKTGKSIKLDADDKPADESITGIMDRQSDPRQPAMDSKDALPQKLGGASPTWCSGTKFWDMLVRKGPDRPDWICFDRYYITPWDEATPFVLLTEAGGVWKQKDNLPFHCVMDPHRPGMIDTNITFLAARNQYVFGRVKQAYFPEWR